MRRYCAVRGCTNKSLHPGDSLLSFHKLPHQRDVAQKWLLAMDNPKYSFDSTPKDFKYAVICNDHFEINDFHDYGGPSTS